MKIFVTGSTGFLGSHLVDRLIERGDSVCCLVRRTSNLRWLENKPVELVYGSPGDKRGGRLLQALEKADYVYHAAGATMGLGKEDYFRINAGGTKNLLEAMLEAGCSPKRFLLVSSLAAAGPGKAGRSVTEEQESPVSWYGESKLEAEKISLDRGKDFPVTIIRPPPVYGPRDSGMLGMFRAVDRGLIVVFRRPTECNYVYISDLVRGMILSAESEKSAGEIFNIGDSENMSVETAMKRVAKAIGKKTVTLKIPLTLAYGAALLSEIKIKVTGTPSIFNWQKMAEMKETNWKMDIGKAEKILGYEPEVRMENGGEKTCNWYRERGWI